MNWQGAKKVESCLACPNIGKMGAGDCRGMYIRNIGLRSSKLNAGVDGGGRAAR